MVFFDSVAMLAPSLVMPWFLAVPWLLLLTLPGLAHAGQNPTLLKPSFMSNISLPNSFHQLFCIFMTCMAYVTGFRFDFCSYEFDCSHQVVLIFFVHSLYLAPVHPYMDCNESNVVTLNVPENMSKWGTWAITEENDGHIEATYTCNGFMALDPETGI